MRHPYKTYSSSVVQWTTHFWLIVVLPRDRRLPVRISCAENWKIRYVPAVTDDFNIAVIRIFTPGLSNTSPIYKHRCYGHKQNYLYLKSLKSTTTVVNAHSESTLRNRLQNVGTVESAVGFQQRRLAPSLSSGCRILCGKGQKPPKRVENSEKHFV